MDYLSEYNSAWPNWFLRLEEYLTPRIPGCLRIEHIGSTSIVGMLAKPIIDMDIVVKDGSMPDAILSIEMAGYHHQRDLAIAEREAFRLIAAITLSLPFHNLYACELSSLELHKHICFRDYLRQHPIEQERLIQFKRHLAFELKLSRNEYIEAKKTSL